MFLVTEGASGSLRLSSEALGRGGEGAVYGVEAHSLDGLPPASKLVVKLYHDSQDGNRLAKLKAMLRKPVSDPAVTWPLALVFDESRNFKGYAMARLEASRTREWLYLANAKERLQIAPDFDTRYALTAIRNLAAAILAVHEAGHRIGDLNESNLLVGADASVLIVDSDSMEIKGADGEVFRCTVGKPEYTAPELSHGSLRDQDRSEESDYFAYAVASYQLLTGGSTPHQGRFDPDSSEDPMSTVDRIRAGVLPSLEPARAGLYGFEPRAGVPIEAFPEFLQEAFRSLLSPDPGSRRLSGGLEGLITSLDTTIASIERCPREKLHFKPSGESCRWCAVADSSGVAVWSSQPIRSSPAQVVLPPVSFESGRQTAAPRRAPAAIAGTQHPQSSPASQVQQQHYAPNHSSPANYGQSASPAPPQSHAPQRPKKIKGKVTVEYANGTWGVRPSLASMFKQSPSMAVWAIKEETWDVLRFWWPVERKTPSPWALVSGFAVSLLAVFGFAFLPAWVGLGSFTSISEQQLLHLVLSLIPTLTSAGASLWLLCSGLRASSRRLSSASASEHPVLTAVRFLPIVVFYGVPAVVVGTVSGLFRFVRAVGRA